MEHTHEGARIFDAEAIDRDALLSAFYATHFESATEHVTTISLETLRALKEKGVTTERVLDYLVQKKGVLLHGSTEHIRGDELHAHGEKIFATNNSAIAILKSVYSNRGVNLQYPLMINEDSPLSLTVHATQERPYSVAEKGSVYIVEPDGFTNDPPGTWQYVSHEPFAKFRAIIETESDDFRYPVHVEPR